MGEKKISIVSMANTPRINMKPGHILADLSEQLRKAAEGGNCGPRGEAGPGPEVTRSAADEAELVALRETVDALRDLAKRLARALEEVVNQPCFTFEESCSQEQDNPCIHKQSATALAAAKEAGLLGDMSSTWSKEVPYIYDLDPTGEPSKHVGRLQYHHTSDTVVWLVDGKTSAIWSNSEFDAFLEALKDIESKP